MNVVKKQAHDYELIAMAWHEAAHTICGLFNFLYVYHVYVMSDKYENGNTLYEIHDPANLNNKLLSKILLIYEVQTLYAGLVGEKMYYKEICGSEAFPMHLRIGSSNDIQDAAKLIHKYNLAEPGKARYLFKKQVQKECQNILEEYWEDVKLIAHGLYRNVELNYDEIRYLLTRRSDNKEFWRVRLKEIKSIYNAKVDLDEKYLKDILVQNSVVII